MLVGAALGAGAGAGVGAGVGALAGITLASGAALGAGAGAGAGVAGIGAVIYAIRHPEIKKADRSSAKKNPSTKERQPLSGLDAAVSVTNNNRGSKEAVGTILVGATLGIAIGSAVGTPAIGIGIGVAAGATVAAGICAGTAAGRYAIRHSEIKKADRSSADRKHLSTREHESNRAPSSVTLACVDSSVQYQTSRAQSGSDDSVSTHCFSWIKKNRRRVAQELQPSSRLNHTGICDDSNVAIVGGYLMGAVVGAVVGLTVSAGVAGTVGAAVGIAAVGAIGTACSNR